MENNLLGKYIFNEASAHERDEVEKWFQEFPANREEFERLQSRIELATRRYRENTFDPQNALSKISKSQISLRTRKVRYIVGAAAVLLLAVILRLLFSAPKEVLLVCNDGEIVTYTLPDDSRLTLTGVATARYGKRFGYKERRVDFSGTGYFEVVKDEERPFVVATPDLEVKVLGTTFQVEKLLEVTSVLVEEGKVEVKPTNGATGEILTAGMAVDFRNDTKQFETIVFDPNRLSWKTGVFRFDDAPLQEVIDLLNRYYKVNIQASELELQQRITVSFHNISLSDALDIINRTLNTNLSID